MRLTMIGENLKRIRTTKTKYSQQDIADILNIERNTYARWEGNENDIKSEYIPKLAELFDVPIQTLFENSSSTINISSNHENKDQATLNGAIIILTDHNAVEQLVKVINDNLKK